MKIQNKIKFICVVICLVVFSNTVCGDDLNPPSYRDDPLSVSAHWVADDTGLSAEPYEWWAVDDSDPSTYLYEGINPRMSIMSSTEDKEYHFDVPNFVDELPLKKVRVQLTWEGTTYPSKLNVSGYGYDPEKAFAFSPTLTYSSTPLVFTQPDGGYQYFDLEFRPNPDYETVSVYTTPEMELKQVVIDTISIPEPATAVILILGGLSLIPKKNPTRV